MTHVSVVVPTRERPLPLARCLAALAHQQAIGAYEIVVVDDAPGGNPATADIVVQESRARLVRTDGAGAATARNAGAAAARGTFLLFTDDDCAPAPAWAAGLVAALGEAADVAGGRTENGVPGDPFVAASEAIRDHLERWARDHPRLPFVASNNMACRRELVLDVPFDETYAGAGGEDRDWCARVGRRGARFAYAADAVVTHVPAIGLAGFWRQQVRYGRGAYRFGSSPGSGRRFQQPAFYVGMIRRGFADGVVPGVLVMLAQAAAAAGYVREAASVRSR